MTRRLFIRDQFMRDLQRDMGHVASHGRYVHMYVNGLYWGISMFVERPSASFSASHLGGQKLEYDAVNSGTATDGRSQTTWNSFLAKTDT